MNILLKIVCVLIFVPLVVSCSEQYSSAALDTMTVSGSKHVIGEHSRIVDDNQGLQKVLSGSTYSIIRKGNDSCSDLYCNGFKRADITFTVDGERFSPACPNRMDTRIGHVDMTDITSIVLSSNSDGLQAGLGGHASFKRRLPEQAPRLYGSLSGSFGNMSNFDGRLSAERNRLRLSGRYRQADPWVDAEDNNFQDKYGYTGLYNSTIAEARVHKAWDGGDAVIGFESSEDLLYPYLKMDERENDHFESSFSHHGHRFYFNRNDHLMDNNLRTSSMMMSEMITDASSTMYGAVGDFYEIYVHNWDADNIITPVANPMMKTNSHMMPDVTRISASVRHDFDKWNEIDLSVRGGFAQTAIGDESALPAYQLLHEDAEKDILSFPFAATATRVFDAGEYSLLGITAELSSEPAGSDQQYISVNKPGMTPDWYGNPTLADPVRATFRTALQQERFKLELFATRVWDYPTQVKMVVDSTPYQTYTGVDALIAGANISASWDYFDASVNWNWAEKTETGTPLAEIQPLQFSLKGHTPEFNGFKGWAHFMHSVTQNRVDETQFETATPSWTKLDLGLSEQFEKFAAFLEIENVLNRQYSQHLSYWRGPFSSYQRVYEPGRAFRLGLSFEL